MVGAYGTRERADPGANPDLQLSSSRWAERQVQKTLRPVQTASTLVRQSNRMAARAIRNTRLRSPGIQPSTNPLELTARQIGRLQRSQAKAQDAFHTDGMLVEKQSKLSADVIGNLR